MFVAHCVQKFWSKNLEKVEKIMNIHEYSKKNLAFFRTLRSALSYE